MVKVLPEPVTPSSTWSRSFARTPLTSSSIACGWSPCGSNSETTRKRRPPSDLSGRGGRWGTHGGRLRMLGSPSSSSALSESAETAAPVRPRGWLSGAGVSNLGCGASENPWPRPPRRSASAGLSSSARCSSSGCRSGREALDLAEDLGAEDLGAEADFRGAGMARNMGRIRGRGKGDPRSVAAQLGLRLKPPGPQTVNISPRARETNVWTKENIWRYETGLGPGKTFPGLIAGDVKQ